MIDFLTGLTIGLHMVSAHVPAHEYQNNVNPGIYVRAENCATAGVFRNTLNRVSAYVGCTPEWDFGLVSAAVTVGLASGYQERVAHDKCDVPGPNCVRPEGFTKGAIGLIIAPSVAVKIDKAALRLGFIPKMLGNQSNVFHLSIEGKF